MSNDHLDVVRIDLDDIPQVSNTKQKKVASKRKTMKGRYEIWDHFEIAEGGIADGGAKVKCKYCSLKYNYNTKKSGTS